MIGIDLVYIPRVERILERRGDDFLHTLFSEPDYKRLKNKRPQHIAALFAAKEAMSKALGRNLFSIGLKNLSVRYEKGGRPYGVCEDVYFDLSIGHEKDYAICLARRRGRKSGVKVSRDMADLLPAMRDADHKGSRGKTAVIGASPGMYGSVDLSTRALLRTGTGLAYAVVPDAMVPSFSLRTVEVIVKGNGDLSFLTEMDAVGIGPGMGRDADARRLFEEVYRGIQVPTVVDADALYHLSQGMELARGDKKIYTPHTAEMARLIEKSAEWVEQHREEAVSLCLKRYGGTVVLKGHRTIIADKAHLVYNDTGNPGMATAGSGDVLTGIITSLLGQGLSCFNAARLGVYIHGLSGDIGALHKSRYSLTASDIVTYLPEAFRLLEMTASEGRGGCRRA
ncbi:MAG: NAD(P)H-hydrate dehydratase [Peptoniphilus sp.]|nr:NAD(P)H-hydrate dehydratase [Peptoniphilus sp.]MDD7362578.1 NAD(P)H-hydrate dehydratase [Bacillota bacterium]MDY6045023.1 NAD(P)H-hydrate dehydratase [Peptoniphilus sp.]